MPSFKFIVRSDRPDSQGLCPVYLRITHNRQKRYLRADFKIDPGQWNSKKGKVRRSHPESKSLNLYLDKMMGRARLAPTQLQTVSAEAIKKILDGTSSMKFTDYAERMKKGLSYNSAQTFNTLISLIGKFRPGLHISEVDTRFISEFRSWLKSRDSAQNTRSLYLSKVGTVLNHAVRNDVIPPSANPFMTGKVKLRWEKTSPTALTPAELKAFRQAEATPSQARDRRLFLFCLYNDGMRVGDALMLNWGAINGNMLEYTMGKTGTHISIQMTTRALQILDDLDTGRDLVFPHLVGCPKPLIKHTKIKIKNINYNLDRLADTAGIDKRITTHVARHTFAWMADEQGWSLTEIQQALGHASITETRNYIGRIRSDRLTGKRDDLFE